MSVVKCLSSIVESHLKELGFLCLYCFDLAYHVHCTSKDTGSLQGANISKI